MSIGTALFLLLILACPLMMIFMMRGHGHGGHAHGDASAASVDELRHRRDVLDREIVAREDDSRHRCGSATPAVSSSADTERAAPETTGGPARARS